MFMTTLPYSCLGYEPPGSPGVERSETASVEGSVHPPHLEGEQALDVVAAVGDARC